MFNTKVGAAYATNSATKLQGLSFADSLAKPTVMTGDSALLGKSMYTQLLYTLAALMYLVCGKAFASIIFLQHICLARHTQAIV